MVISLKRPKRILLALAAVLIAASAAVSLRYVDPTDPAKAASTIFEEQTAEDKVLVYLFSEWIQEQSNAFYAPYYTIPPSIAYYLTAVKEVKADGGRFYLTFSTLPYLGPHDTIGEDEITFRVDPSGVVTPVGFKHLKNYSLPDNLSNLARGPLPPVTG